MHFANVMDAPAADETRLILLANHLIGIDLAAIAAYKTALPRLSCSAARAALTAHLADHERHVDVLSELVAANGGMPPAEGDFSSLLCVGKVLVAKFAGDAGILAAMRSNEQAPLAAYDRALGAASLSPAERTLLRHHLQDEHRHSRLIGVKLEDLSRFRVSSMCQAM